MTQNNGNTIGTSIPNAPVMVGLIRENGDRYKVYMPLRDAVKTLKIAQRDHPTDIFIRHQMVQLENTMSGQYGSRAWRRFVARVLQPQRRLQRGGATSYGLPFTPIHILPLAWGDDDGVEGGNE